MPQRHSLYNNMKKGKQKNYYKMNKKQILMNTLKEKNFREFLFKILTNQFVIISQNRIFHNNLTGNETIQQKMTYYTHIVSKVDT